LAWAATEAYAQTVGRGARIGYGQVSTRDQNRDSQGDALLAAGCDPDHLFIDHGVTGKLARRAAAGCPHGLPAPATFW
jgi:hypothetical protein